MSAPFYVSPEQLMKDRADFARKGIGRGRSVVAVQYADGVLFVSENPSQALHKVSEIYDRIAFAAVGRYNEFENLRIAGVRLADMRGYAYDRRDVTGRGLANAYAQTLGTIFSSGGEKPYEVEIFVAEVGDAAADDQLFRLTYDGQVADEHGFAVMGGPVDVVATPRGRYAEGAPLADALAEAVLGHPRQSRDRLGPRPDRRRPGRPGAAVPPRPRPRRALAARRARRRRRGAGRRRRARAARGDRVRRRLRRARRQHRPAQPHPAAPRRPRPRRPPRRRPVPRRARGDRGRAAVRRRAATSSCPPAVSAPPSRPTSPSTTPACSELPRLLTLEASLVSAVWDQTADFGPRTTRLVPNVGPERRGSARLGRDMLSSLRRSIHRPATLVWEPSPRLTLPRMHRTTDAHRRPDEPDPTRTPPSAAGPLRGFQRISHGLYRRPGTA